MGLKVLTTAFLLLGFGLIAGYPWLINARPTANEPVKVRRVYVQRFFGYNILLLTSVVGAGVGSILILRAAREAYREEANLNLRILLETSLKDHEPAAEPRNEA